MNILHLRWCCWLTATLILSPTSAFPKHTTSCSLPPSSRAFRSTTLSTPGMHFNHDNLPLRNNQQSLAALFQKSSPDDDKAEGMATKYNQIQRNLDDDDDKDLVRLEDMDWETSRIEQEQSRKVWFRLMAPDLIRKYITTALWVFVAVGYLLNFFGYSYLLKDGQLTIDTLEARQFQDEITRGLREAARNAPK